MKTVYVALAALSPALLLSGGTLTWGGGGILGYRDRLLD